MIFPLEGIVKHHHLSLSALPANIELTSEKPIVIFYLQQY